MRIKKLAGGGLPAFVSYVNVEQALPAYAGIGSSSASAESTSSSKSSSSKSGSSSDIGLLNKEMQKILMENGLPSDVQYFLQKADVFGNSVDPLDPHSQERIYTKLLSMLPEIKQNKAEYDDAIQHAREKGTLDQVAVTKDGYIYVLNKETGQLDRKAPNVELDPSKFEKLTNGQLLQMRAYSLGHAMDKGDFTTLVASSISFADIEKSITDKIDKLGKSTMSQEGFVRKDSKNAELMKGYEQIVGQGEDGVYKITSKTVSQNSQAKAFLNYLGKSLSRQERAVLMNRASENGTTIESVLIDLLQGRLTDEQDIKVSFDKTATNGADTDENGNKRTFKMNQIMSIITGDGLQHTNFVISPGKGSGYQVDAQIISWIPKAGGQGTVGPGSAVDALLTSELGRVLDTDSMHIGGQRIDASQLSKMYYDGQKSYAMDLPVTYDKNGKPMPNWDLLDNYNKAKAEIARRGGNLSPEQVNQIFRSRGLSNYFNADGTPNRRSFMRFLGVSLLADESVFQDADDYPEWFTKVDDDYVRNRMSTELGADKRNPLKLDGDLYRGTVFVPIYDSFNNARVASGQSPWVSDPGYEQQMADEQMMYQQMNEPQVVNQLSKSQL